MTKIYVANSKDRVMCSENGHLEEQWRIGNKHMVTRWQGDENEVKCKLMKVGCVVLVNMNAKDCDSEWYG